MHINKEQSKHASTANKQCTHAYCVRLQTTKATLSKLPLTSLILETDAPDMPIYQQSSSYNSPLNIISIYKALCELREETPLAVEQQLYLNTESIFPIIND